MTDQQAMLDAAIREAQRQRVIARKWLKVAQFQYMARRRAERERDALAARLNAAQDANAVRLYWGGTYAPTTLCSTTSGHGEIR